MSEDRVMVVTGASSGLGAEVSEHFALQGYRVAMNRPSGATSTPTAATPQPATRGCSLVDGDSAAVSRVEVRWPDGTAERWTEVRIGEYQTLVQGEGEALRSRP